MIGFVLILIVSAGCILWLPTLTRRLPRRLRLCGVL